ncbi:MAG: AAA family ATPase [Roseburia sp.]|nr:AAA family ATPase [Roseburia sp.]
MGMYLNLGNAGFQSVRKGLYVDKTELISFINGTLGTKDKLTCVSRPRRFGKSYATQMLCAYYDKSCDSRELFHDLKIAEDKTYEKYLNKYDVIYLDITWFISTSKNIKNTVSHLQEQVTKELQGLYPSVEEEGSLPMLLSKINEATGQKFIIIIDEWDALFREAKDDTDLQKEYIQLLRGLFKSSQTDKMIEAAYMTGILPIKKYGTQSALTDFREYTMISPKKLAKYVGFTETEVMQLCEEHNIDFEETKRWYDGYSFSKIKSVYSPNSVVQAIQNEEFGTYWTETETYESLKIYIDMDEDGLKESIVQMLGGARCPVDIGTFQNDMTSIKSKDDVLTLLVHLGYLAYDAKSESVYIPNEEVRREFIRAVKAGKHTEIAKMVLASDRLLQDTLNMNSERVAAAIQDAHSASTAPNFYNNEQALRSTVRFAYLSCVEEFKDIQELPSGIGYADVVYLPKKNSTMPIMVVELKWNRSAGGAIEQIKNRNYPQIFDGYGSDILLVGINYDEKTKKHECLIEKYKK